MSRVQDKDAQERPDAEPAHQAVTQGSSGATLSRELPGVRMGTGARHDMPGVCDAGDAGTHCGINYGETMTISEQFDTFFKKATADKYPFSKDACLELGFYAGWHAAMRMGSVGKSDAESEAEFVGILTELQTAFTPENIERLYSKPVKVKA